MKIITDGLPIKFAIFQRVSTVAPLLNKIAERKNLLPLCRNFKQAASELKLMILVAEQNRGENFVFDLFNDRHFEIIENIIVKSLKQN